MPTEKQNVAYIDKRIAVYEAARKLAAERAVQSPTKSRLYTTKAATQAASIKALEHVKHFIKTGQEHPDLIQIPVQSEEEALVGNEASTMPAVPKEVNGE